MRPSYCSWNFLLSKKITFNIKMRHSRTKMANILSDEVLVSHEKFASRFYAKKRNYFFNRILLIIIVHTNSLFEIAIVHVTTLYRVRKKSCIRSSAATLCFWTDVDFQRISHIIKDINSGWLIRLIHINGASFYFIFFLFLLIYIHLY